MSTSERPLRRDGKSHDTIFPPALFHESARAWLRCGPVEGDGVVRFPCSYALEAVRRLAEAAANSHREVTGDRGNPVLQPYFKVMDGLEATICLDRVPK